MNNNIPKDLGGYQSICTGLFNAGDILLDTEFAYPMSGRNVESTDLPFLNLPWDEDPIHRWLHEPLNTTRRIYRKMACPKQSDGKQGVQSGIDMEEYNRRIGGGQTGPAAVRPDVRLKAETYDNGKDPLAYLPWAGIRAVSRVQAYGHKKYNDYNNFRKGMEVGRNLSCALRHIASYMEGETLDPESKESHLAHAACRLLFVLQNEHDKVATDDRYKRS